MYCDYKPRKPGSFVCCNCGERTSKRMYYETSPIRNCPMFGPSPKPDPVAWFTAHHATIARKPWCPPLPDILARLDRCLSSDCPELIDNVCTIYEGSGCMRRAAWFNRLRKRDCNKITCPGGSCSRR